MGLDIYLYEMNTPTQETDEELIQGLDDYKLQAFLPEEIPKGLKIPHKKVHLTSKYIIDHYLLDSYEVLENMLGHPIIRRIQHPECADSLLVYLALVPDDYELNYRGSSYSSYALQSYCVTHKTTGKNTDHHFFAGPQPPEFTNLFFPKDFEPPLRKFETVPYATDYYTFVFHNFPFEITSMVITPDMYDLVLAEIVKREGKTKEELTLRYVTELDEVAYQRKGVDSDFYVMYENSRHYFQRKDVQDFVRFCSDPETKLRAKIKFLDIFKRGKHTFYADW